jgi:predicted phage terminase large subunit-like protein
MSTKRACLACFNTIFLLPPPKFVLPANRVKFTTLDLAVSQASDSDRTAIVTCSVCQFSTESRPKLLVEHISAGHFKPLDTVEKLFDIYKKHAPVNIRTEDVAFQRLLAPIVQMVGQQKGFYLPLIWMKRDNREAKESRIASLQAWFERGDIKILDSCPQKEELVLELTRFPKYRRNDIIDALADQLHNVGFFAAIDSKPLPDLTSRCGDARIGLL